MAQRSVLVQELEALVGSDRVLSDPIDLQCYPYDSGLSSLLHPQVPEVVVVPRSTQEVAAVIRYARDHRLPVTPRGAGSGQAGGGVASPGAIVIDSSAMNRVLEVDTVNVQARVQPGIAYVALNRQLEPFHLFLPPDPSSGQACTLGGMVANNSSGPRSLKHGPVGHYVLGLEVVLPNGEVIVTGGEKSKALKSSSGLNLTQLFVGSGGTLGFVTEIRLRLLHKPTTRAAALLAFGDMEDGWQMVQEVWRAGVVPNAMEFEYPAPGTTSAAAEFRPAFHMPEAELVVIVELEGNEAGVHQDLQSVLEIGRRLAQRIEFADDPHGVAEMWEMLDSVEGASSQIRPGARRIPGGEDISVPLNRMTEALKRIRSITEQHGIGVVSFGHAAQGNIHSGLLVKLEDPREVEGAEAAMREIHLMALEMGGSLTGEHGIGTSRLEFVATEHGTAYLAMAQIKKALDPDNIMNPGKVFSPEVLSSAS